MQSLQGATIHFYPEQQFCLDCGQRLQVAKTQTRGVITLEYGSLQAHETVCWCPRACTGPGGKRRLYRSALLGTLVAPRHVYGFDVLAKVGVLRFLGCRQRLEIQEELQSAYDLWIPEGTIEELIGRFLEAIRALHEAKVPALRETFAHSGGYVLHVDGTCEEGSQVHFACLAGVEGIVLWSEKIGSENAVEIRGVLAEVDRRFGKPAATVEDLSPAIRNAVSQQWPGLPVFYCHQHFLRDVGKDLLGGHYKRLRAALRDSEIRSELRQLSKSVSKDLGERKSDARRLCQDLEALALLKGKERSLKASVVTGGIAEWILWAATEGNGQGFPFDLPHLSFYLRATEAFDIVERGVLRKLPGGRTPRAERLLYRLRGILHTFLKSTALERTARALQEVNSVFNRLRGALRLAAEGSRDGMNEDNCYKSPQEVKEAEDALSKLREELRREQEGKLSPARHKAVGIVLKHLDKYWGGLFGHYLPLDTEEQRYLMAQRTNNIAEQFFRRIKRFGRRTSGKKKLNREVEALPGHAPLVFNLKTPQYVKLVCGSLEGLSEAFATLAQGGKLSKAPLKAAELTLLNRKTRRRPDFPTKLVAAYSAG